MLQAHQRPRRLARLAQALAVARPLPVQSEWQLEWQAMLLGSWASLVQH